MRCGRGFVCRVVKSGESEWSFLLLFEIKSVLAILHNVFVRM